MNTSLDDEWLLHQKKNKELLIYGLQYGYIRPYNDKLIMRLRNITYGGIPASIILLSDYLSNGFCYERSILLAEALLDLLQDIKLVYASIESLRINPKIKDRDDLLYADHCFIEGVYDNKKYIFDTSLGFIFDKDIYIRMEKPIIRKENNKEKIIKYLEMDKLYHSEDIERDKYMAPIVLPYIERVYGRATEMYSHDGILLLQREIEHFKEVINYNEIYNNMNDDIKRLVK
jgi:hypothetical protein